MKLIKTDNKTVTIYHQNANTSERILFDIKTYIRSFMLNDKIKDNWASFLPLANYAFNITPHSVTGISPHSLLFGRLANDPISNLTMKPIYTYNDFYDEIRQKIKIFNETAKIKLEKHKDIDQNKRNLTAKQRNFIPGEKVLVKNS